MTPSGVTLSRIAANDRNHCTPCSAAIAPSIRRIDDRDEFRGRLCKNVLDVALSDQAGPHHRKRYRCSHGYACAAFSLSSINRPNRCSAS